MKQLLKWILTGTVFFLIICLIMIQLNSKHEIEPGQSENGNNLQLMYYVGYSNFTDFNVIPSSLYTNVNSIHDEYVLGNFEKYISHMDPIDPPEFHESEKIFFNLSLVYKDGTINNYKLLPIGYIYNINEEKWYTRDSLELRRLGINEYVLYDTIRNGGTKWISILLILCSIVSFISEKLIKRKYDIDKIRKIEKNKIAKVCYYILLIAFIVLLLAIVFFRIVVHIGWIILLLLILTIVGVLLEWKYGSGKPSLYYMIIDKLLFNIIIITLIILI